MEIKIVMTWNIRENREPEYSEFIVNEFIPRLNRIGLRKLEFWYTSFGEINQIHATGIAKSMSEMKVVTQSEEWESLQDMLQGYVKDYTQKLIKNDGGFQI
ncbi:MAG: hypothetical protein AAF633_15495 [Chloroflexota bacterium]